uniref:Uncharacterized protein n=1 Tax=Oryza meridionalis TaxID=40149 RepID=A0A0E0DCY7_9ORYZ
MPKSRCSRIVKDETSYRVCQTPGQLGTNARAGAWRRGGDARSRRRRPAWLTMISADDVGVDAQVAIETAKVAKLRSERTTQLQLHVDAVAKSPPKHSGPRGRRELDGVDACSMMIGCKSNCSQVLEWVIKPKMREAE